ncbi:methyl-accepting chemotaxis protein [Burkholderia sp. Ax-1719]|uniref:methyl-accepting chemotaxis protein n=1 Tax=Burkholderia sp. Ax-1719 TaxID=2608334 RepID=UPI0014229D23|nr:methyl-accepting chemotaxis protein [Burkholderia sp. Ax-1719]NIE66905.1 HAMP domain-containing protein [Burkholderia sp. Ax-1719]
MVTISRHTIGIRLAASFGVVLAFLVVLTTVGVIRVGKIDSSLTTISDVNGVRERYAINFRGSVHNRAIALRDVVFEGTDAGLQTQLSLIKKLTDDYTQSAQPLDQMFSADTGITGEERADLAKIKSIEAHTLPLIAKVIELRASGNLPEATRILLTEARPSFNDWLDSINALIDLEEKISQNLSVNARSVAGSFSMLMLVLCALAIIVGVWVAWFITRSIVLPIRQASEFARSVATGDLTVQIDSASNDETGQLLKSLKTMLDSLASVVSGVRTSTDNVATAASEIAAGNVDLSSRTAEQASSLEETAASMTQLTETVKHNADNARQANALAIRATNVADAGNNAVQGMVGTIDKINGSSTKISEITGVIEGIAFQTNILALNAAVEAARAGEQGRGFAVVASEVRSLAQRSATAAKEIKELIGLSVTMIEDGAKQATQVNATMGEVKQAIKQVSDIVGEITAASEEQSRGIEQVNQAVGQMDEVTQQNAALVEQSAAATHSLEEQAQILKKAVAVFKIADAGTHAVPPRLTREGLPKSWH